MTTVLPLERFRLSRLRLIVEAPEGWELPEFAGNTLRGGFGYALRAACCVARGRQCPECLLRGRCLYARTFEAQRPAGADLYRNMTAVPRPFVLEPPLARSLPPGGRAEFGLVLVGEAMSALPYFIYALTELGRLGVGQRRSPYLLCAAEGWGLAGWQPVYDGGREVLLGEPPTVGQAEIAALAAQHRGQGQAALHLLTPLRLKFAQHLAEGAEFHILARNLLRRVSQLGYFHCGQALQVDFRGLITAAQQVRIAAADLRWHDLQRFSGRQQAAMRLGGLLGRVVYAGDLAPWWELLALGELVHAGKNTTFGLGQYRLE